jgi:predicted PurR-regulated permease PerM
MSAHEKPRDPGLDLVTDEELDTEPGSVRKDVRALTSLAIGWAIVVALYVARDVLVPIALAILLSFALAPVVRILRRVGFSRAPSVFLAVFFALAMILSLGGVIGMQTSEIISDLPAYATIIDRKVTKLRDMLTNTVNEVITTFTSHLPRVSMPDRPRATRNAPDVANRPLPVEIHQPDPTPMELAERLLPPVVLPLASVGMVFVVSIFILLRQNDVRDRLIRLFGLQDMHRTTRALDDAAHRLTRYLLAQLGVNALFGVIVGIGLTFIGVPKPLLWGTLSALFRFLPYLGSFLCAALPIALAAAVDPGWNMAIYTALLFIVTEIMMGQFVDPLAFGRSTGLSPLSVVIAATFWTWMWGPIGLPLSMPLTVCLVVLGRHVKQLEFLDILMGDRPALTPVERFCQRILANDPEEALEFAEELLKQLTLIDYYDEVVIKGLQLVASDVERSPRSAELLARVQRTMARLIKRLDDMEGAHAPGDEATSRHADGTREPDAPDAELVLCVPVGEPLDRVVAEILARLMTKQGLRTRIVQYSASAYDTVSRFDAEGAWFICVCSLDLSLNPAQARYLVRRIRRAAPDTPILAGLLPGSLADSYVDQLRREVGADRLVSSLRDAVNFRPSSRGVAELARQPAPASAAR